MKRLVLAACVIAMTAVIASCRTDYSKSAVERARSYALSNLSGLTDGQRSYIRYTQPEIYENIVYPRYVVPLNTGSGHVEVDDVRHFPTAPSRDLMHSCVVWSPPDLGAKVVVAGEGERSMLFWQPYRVIVKRYDPGDTGFKGASMAASQYVRDNMLYLTTGELNRVRFDKPEAVYTRLPASPEAAAAETTPWEDYLNADKNKPVQNTQMSLAWPADDPAQRIVVTGFSTTGTLSGWKVRTCELMAASKLDAARLSREEIDAIPKQVPVRALVFPAQESPDRNPYDSANNAKAPYTGTITR